MHVAIVGAGYSGLVAGTTLLSFSHQVTIFDSAPDVGGVWSSTRHYPGLKAQNTKVTYAYSTMSMPREYPLHPDARQIQAYLENYARVNGLYEEDRLRLSTEAVNAIPRDNGWVIEAQSPDGQVSMLFFDHLIIATGVFSVPFVPSYPGLDAFQASGGQVLHTSQLTDSHVAKLTGKRVVVVGYGKSACDSAVAIAASNARLTTIVARDLIWKLPTYVGGLVRYSLILCTRFGEALFPYVRPWKSQRFLSYGPGRNVRWLLLWSLAKIISLQLKLVKFNLVPDKPFETIARSNVSLATPGFVAVLETGALSVERDVSLNSLSEGNLTLSNGKIVPVDVIVCGTGWSHSVPSFLPPGYRSRLVDEHGDWQLYRHILPIGISNLSFIGFNSSIFCQLSAEVASLWLAAHLESSKDIPLLTLPNEEERRRQAREDGVWLRKRADDHHAKGTSLTPFSMSNIDEMLDDLKLKIGWWDYIWEWALPINPAAYAHLLPTLKKRRDKLQALSHKRK